MKINNDNHILDIIEGMARYQPKSDKDDFKNWDSGLFNYLLLSNAALCWERWPYRYSFEKHRQVDVWTMEHIFARNQKDLNESEFKDWLGEKYSPQKFEDYQKECKENKGDKWLFDELGSRYPSTEDNSINNLALLPRDANSSFNNKLFEGKRELVVQWSNERWITYWAPPVTEAVFMKSLTGLKMTLPYWSEEDKKAYYSSIKKTIKNFITALKTPLTL